MKKANSDNPWLEGLRLVRWPAAALLIVVAGWLGVMQFLAFSRDTVVEGSKTAAAALSGLAEGFHSARITETFRASVPTLLDEDLALQVAVFETTESIERQDERWTFFDLVPLGKTVSEIRVPVTYRYQLSLEEPWTLTVREGVCFVRAPPIRPALPPAIHTDGMEKRVESSWLRFDGETMLADLEKSLTPRLAARAAAPERIDLVRERCRRKVALFVRNWILGEGQLGEGRIVAVEVLFADEGEDFYFAPPKG